MNSDAKDSPRVLWPFVRDMITIAKSAAAPVSVVALDVVLGHIREGKLCGFSAKFHRKAAGSTGGLCSSGSCSLVLALWATFEKSRRDAQAKIDEVEP